MTARCSSWPWVENVQREDLSPIDEAKGYHSLATKLSMTHERSHNGSESIGRGHEFAQTAGSSARDSDMVSRGH